MILHSNNVVTWHWTISNNNTHD